MFVLLALLLQAVTSITPDSYCEHPFPSWRTEDYPLKHLTVIIRHGDRSPVFPCWATQNPWECTLNHQERPGGQLSQSPESTSNRLFARDFVLDRNINPGNCANGQLTQIGYQQQIKNGEALKSLYGKVLPKEFDPSMIYVRSTYVPRTFLSVESLLYGLYPPEEGCTDAPITIETVDQDTDNMTPNTKFCKGYANLQNEFFETPAYKEFHDKVILPLEDTLQKVFNVDPGYDIDLMYDCIQANLCHKHEFPEDFTQELYDRVIKVNMDDYAAMSFYKPANSPFNAVQVAMGSFIGDVISNIDKVATNQTDQFLSIFSGHDTTVLPFVMAYGTWDGIWPPYASMIRIELLEGPDQDYIRLYYNDKLHDIPGCGSSLCPYSVFKKISDNLASAHQYC